jgi:hypothetical protein
LPGIAWGVAFLAYYRRGNVDLKAALLIAIGFMIGGYLGGVWGSASQTWRCGESSESYCWLSALRRSRARFLNRNFPQQPSFQKARMPKDLFRKK